MSTASPAPRTSTAAPKLRAVSVSYFAPQLFSTDFTPLPLPDESEAPRRPTMRAATSTR